MWARGPAIYPSVDTLSLDSTQRGEEWCWDCSMGIFIDVCVCFVCAGVYICVCVCLHVCVCLLVYFCVFVRVDVCVCVLA